MTSAMLTDLLKSLGLLGGALMVGVFLRSKLGFLQKTFIPASVIGGFLLLLLGPQVFNVTGKLGVPTEWYSYYSMIPGILIVPVVAGVPLGLRLNRKGSEGMDSGFIKNVFPLFFIGLGVSMTQFAVGYLVHLLFQGSYNFYNQFGIELAIGFVGGHGTAGTLGNTLKELNLPYWETAQGVATTTATFGIVGGILIGIALINWAARSGRTALLNKPADIPAVFLRGYERDVTKQHSMGRETTQSSSVDALAFHTALIFLACGLAYLCIKGAKAANIPVLKSISVWAYGMVCMFVIWGIICRLKIDYLVDGAVKSHITGSFTEFAVTGAVASLPIKAVATYILPIVVMCFIGYIVTTLWLVWLSKKLLKGYWFEQMIGTLGMATGVFITGVMLLRICDPDLKSPALTTYSLSYTATSIAYFALLNLFITLPETSGVLMTVIVACGISLACLVAAIISGRLCFGKVENP
ncbi:sodium/glutamate symporter [Stomatobaculum longum]|jgi:putative Na+/glutamate symporter|uniref:sodium/glutamate symporter n=1 Tax=Stomatobaculum longum TaxID=796942 RepID=UPI003C764143